MVIHYQYSALLYQSSHNKRIMQQVNRSEELIPVQEKYALTIREASEYFSIGIKKMRRLAEDNLGRFAIYSGNRYLIIRTKFEKFMEETSTI